MLLEDSIEALWWVEKEEEEEETEVSGRQGVQDLASSNGARARDQKLCHLMMTAVQILIRRVWEG